ncbi:MAG: hypothetical protein IJ583_17935 [Firmicutes bacterium]|nr:hypothetical protein [Bacillota bacterium]
MISFIEYPSFEQIIELKSEIPQGEKVVSILENEVQSGNEILNIGNAGNLPDVTYINIQLRNRASKEYDNMKDHGTPYKSLSFHDNKGAVEIWFGLGDI